MGVGRGGLASKAKGSNNMSCTSSRAGQQQGRRNGLMHAPQGQGPSWSLSLREEGQSHKRHLVIPRGPGKRNRQQTDGAKAQSLEGHAKEPSLHPAVQEAMTRQKIRDRLQRLKKQGFTASMWGWGHEKRGELLLDFKSGNSFIKLKWFWVQNYYWSYQQSRVRPQRNLSIKNPTNGMICRQTEWVHHPKPVSENQRSSALKRDCVIPCKLLHLSVSFVLLSIKRGQQQHIFIRTKREDRHHGSRMAPGTGNVLHKCYLLFSDGFPYGCLPRMKKNRSQAPKWLFPTLGSNCWKKSDFFGIGESSQLPTLCR